MNRIPERMTDNDIVSGPDTRMPQLKREIVRAPSWRRLWNWFWWGHRVPLAVDRIQIIPADFDETAERENGE